MYTNPRGSFRINRCEEYSAYSVYERMVIPLMRGADIAAYDNDVRLGIS